MSLGHVGLIVVDVQNDFCEGGSLAVAGGNDVAHKIVDYISKSHKNYETVVFTKDWHNPLPDTNGGHFDEWPVHCVRGTWGAQLHEVFDQHSLPWSGHHVFRKGQGKPDYSGFQGVNIHGQSLEDYLKSLEVDELHIVGIAGDYCVKATGLDAKRLGFKAYLLPSMIASVGGPKATNDAQFEVATA